MESGLKPGCLTLEPAVFSNAILPHVKVKRYYLVIWVWGKRYSLRHILLRTYNLDERSKLQQSWTSHLNLGCCSSSSGNGGALQRSRKWRGQARGCSLGNVHLGGGRGQQALREQEEVVRREWHSVVIHATENSRERLLVKRSPLKCLKKKTTVW